MPFSESKCQSIIQPKLFSNGFTKSFHFMWWPRPCRTHHTCTARFFSEEVCRVSSFVDGTTKQEITFSAEALLTKMHDTFIHDRKQLKDLGYKKWPNLFSLVILSNAFMAIWISWEKKERKYQAGTGLKNYKR